MEFQVPSLDLAVGVVWDASQVDGKYLFLNYAFKINSELIRKKTALAFHIFKKIKYRVCIRAVFVALGSWIHFAP